jgi:hypothetical protein
MMMSLFYCTFWFLMRGAHWSRPSCLHRAFVHDWLFILTWAILVPVTVLEDRSHLAFGYPIVILHSALFLAALISLLEMFALPSMRDFSWHRHDAHMNQDNSPTAQSAGRVDGAPDARQSESTGSWWGGPSKNTKPGASQSSTSVSTKNPAQESTSAAQRPEPNEDDHLPTETTPLIQASDGADDRMTFGTAYRRLMPTPGGGLDGPTDIAEGPGGRNKPFDGEQYWSGYLPSWTWILQFLLVAPTTLVIFGQVGLFMVSALSGTGVDGSSTLFPYILIAAFSVILLLPITPFIHRVTWHLPVLLLLVLGGTVFYNLTAFPFSSNNRFKAFFQQAVDLDTGSSVVKITGIEKYVRPLVEGLPSAAGQEISCNPAVRPGLATCEYNSSVVPPNLDGSVPLKNLADLRYEGLVSINITRPDANLNQATMIISAKNTKACFVSFDQPLDSFKVRGSNALDPTFGEYPEAGVCQLKLWSREWGKEWTVDFGWKPVNGSATQAEGLRHDGSGHDESRRQDVEGADVATSRSVMDGRVTCIWSDANEKGAIPAFDEVLQYCPDWVGITKAAEGLVEGSKKFTI